MGQEQFNVCSVSAVPGCLFRKSHLEATGLQTDFSFYYELVLLDLTSDIFIFFFKTPPSEVKYYAAEGRHFAVDFLKNAHQRLSCVSA